MTLRVIDVSSNQGLIKISPIDCDAVITKATGGNSYINDCCDYVVQQCKQLNKPWGFYHFAHEFGVVSSPETEAKFFIDNTKNYFTHGLVALDYEIAINGKSYTQQDIDWIEQFINYVYQQTGVYCLLYISKSLVTSAGDWSKVAKMAGLWFAQYADNNFTGWQSNPWSDNKSTSPFTVVMQQFTGHGRINGYSNDLDLSLFYGDTNAWNKYANPKQTFTPKKEDVKVNQNDYLTAFAKDVIAGKYGNGNERKEKIFQAVQNKVNELVK